jgi:hypothetical protein
LESIKKKLKPPQEAQGPQQPQAAIRKKVKEDLARLERSRFDKLKEKGH